MPSLVRTLDIKTALSGGLSGQITLPLGENQPVYVERQ
jgi:hypothetical protein